MTFSEFNTIGYVLFNINTMFTKNFNLIKSFAIILLIYPLINSCGIYRPVDAKDYPPEPEKRVAKNIEEGRGIRIWQGMGKKGGTFDFASSNSLWRASLEKINFMPLLTADYGGGIIVTDWYNSTNDENKAIKISIQFLSNEVRSDALEIKVFKKNCEINKSCKIINSEGKLNSELKLAILKRAAVLEKTKDQKGKKDYKTVKTSGDK
tara:strand:+ start:158 stop:781 length:624 start_codon:yes stop_codon:yes gene_type:complete